jgi:RNA polymerase sigma-70 factor (ECF subfamily)
MAKGQPNGVLPHLRRVELLRDGAGLPDGELLECYLASRDEAAFEALLRRHGPMVLGTCRRVLRNEADAHDAFQATFLVFVRKAASIVPRARVGNWLYGVAHKTALKANAMNRQRRAKEMQAPAPQTTPAEDLVRELLGVLDEALSRLPDKYRTAIVLCDLEEKSLHEAARQLGCPQGTVASRLARARDLLARRLARYGSSVAGGALATALAHGAASAPLPTGLIDSTVQAANQVAAPHAAAVGVVSSRVVALTEGMLAAMRAPTWKALTAALLAVALVGGGGALFTSVSRSARPEGAMPEVLPPPAAPKEAKARTDREALQGTWVAISGERNGVKFSDQQLKAWGQLVFTGDRFSREGTERSAGTYVLAPDKRPKEIDLMNELSNWKGIYELNGTTLRLALLFGDERPTEMSSRLALLIVFEKK